MTPLEYSTGSFRSAHARTAQTPQQRAFGMAFAIAIEVGIVAALVLTLEYVKAPPLNPPPLQFYNIAPPDKIDNTPPPPQQVFDPPQVDVITPVIELTYTPPPSTTAISVPPPVPATPPREATPPLPPVTFTPARAIASSHTTPEYPFISRRLREQGTLRLKLTIDGKGNVTEAVVVNSSGFQRLDEAAVSWVKAHWLYTPAMQGTRAVASMVDAIVEFRLQ